MILRHVIGVLHRRAPAGVCLGSLCVNVVVGERKEAQTGEFRGEGSPLCRISASLTVGIGSFHFWVRKGTTRLITLGS